MIEEIEKYALDNRVPIMVPDGINYLVNYIKDNNVKEILEIGTAIGYSAIKMALVSKDIHIVTLERDIDRYNEAIKNIHRFNLDKQIDVILGDALEVDIKGEYDLIFIDAAKSQYLKFFNKYKLLLKNNGTIITDNLDFHGYRENMDTIKSRNLKQMMRKLNTYVEFLETNEEFKTDFVNIGDGLGVSKRK